MNRKNWKLAMEVIEATPEHEFDMSEYMMLNGALDDPETFKDWSLDNFLKGRLLFFCDMKSDGDLAVQVFKKYGELPCGSVSCIAGTIQYNFDTERELDSQAFSMEFLGISFSQSCRLFEKASLYGKKSLKDVTKADALNMMQKIYDGEVEL